MNIKNFLFSYKNILKNEIDNRRFFSCLRKTINLLYKYLINLSKKYLIKRFENLDNDQNSLLYKFSLNKLFLKFNCDKGSKIKLKNEKYLLTHNYSKFYEKYFSDYRKKKINFLEIGSHEGNGLASFYFFFPYAKFYGANINPFQMKYQAKRMEEIYIDVSSRNILNNFSKYFKEDFDLIVDDASHNIKDILQTLSILFKNLKKGGMYIIEDINQFKVYPNLNPENYEFSPMDVLEKIKKEKNFESPYISNSDIEYLKENIENIYFEKGDMVLQDINISEIVFIKKK